MASTAATGEAPRLDRAILDQLMEMIGRDTVKGFIEEYLTEANRQLVEMRVRWAEADHDGVYRPAHNLVSTSGNFGVMRVSQLADKVQRACRAHDDTAIGPLIESLGAEVEASSAELRKVFAAEA